MTQQAEPLELGAEGWIEMDPVWRRLRACLAKQPCPRIPWQVRAAEYVCIFVLGYSVAGTLYFGIQAIRHFHEWAWILR